MRYITYPYDTEEYPFVEIIRSLFALSRSSIELNVLHELTSDKYEIFEVGKDSSTIFHRLFYDKYHTGWPELQNLYDKFIKEIIAPQFNEDILYQKFPTFRVQIPGNIAVGGWHNDAEYHHPEGEINYIIPLTDSGQTASIWLESEPGKKDFQPMMLEVGDYIRFRGNSLTHGNKVNETGKTRVSIDFRILPASKYSEANIGESMTLKTKFREGEYYKRLVK